MLHQQFIELFGTTQQPMFDEDYEPALQAGLPVAFRVEEFSWTQGYTEYFEEAIVVDWFDDYDGRKVGLLLPNGTMRDMRFEDVYLWVNYDYLAEGW